MSIMTRDSTCGATTPGGRAIRQEGRRTGRWQVHQLQHAWHSFLRLAFEQVVEGTGPGLVDPLDGADPRVVFAPRS